MPTVGLGESSFPSIYRVTACADKLLQSGLLLKEGSPHGRRLFRRPRVARMEKPFGEGTEDHAECQKLKIAGNGQKRQFSIG
jgi:hypothetical protein